MNKKKKKTKTRVTVTNSALAKFVNLRTAASPKVQTSLYNEVEPLK